MKSQGGILFLSLLSSVNAQFAYSSSYADKCVFSPETGHRYHLREGPIGSTHKSTFICGSYPFQADFTPVPGATSADDCALACSGSCDAATWSEVSGTENRCHLIHNWDDSMDNTEALIMIMLQPVPASAAEQMSWICEGHTSDDAPISKFQPPNLEIQYYCDSAPALDYNVANTEVDADSPESCVQNCMEMSNAGFACSGALWTADSPNCLLVAHPGNGVISRPGELYIKYVEHILPGDDKNNDNNGPPGEDNGPPGGEDDGPPGGEEDGPPGGEDDGPPGGDDDGPPGGEDNGPPGGEDDGPPGGDDDGPPGGEDDGPPGGDDDGPPAGDNDGPPGSG